MNTLKNDMKNLGRLKGRSDFLRVRDSGQKWVSNSVIVQKAAGKGAHDRFGVTVTKRLEKSAVRRNRMKRRLRAAAYDIIAAKGGGAAAGAISDYVLIARKETATNDYASLKKDLGWCLKRLSTKNETAS